MCTVSVLNGLAHLLSQLFILKTVFIIREQGGGYRSKVSLFEHILEGSLWRSRNYCPKNQKFLDKQNLCKLA